MSWSIVTVPAIGWRRPPMSTSPPVADSVARHAVGVADGHGGHRARRAASCSATRTRAGRPPGAASRGRRAPSPPSPGATAPGRRARAPGATPYTAIPQRTRSKRARSANASRAAELAAWTTSNAGRRARSSSSTASNRSSCCGVYGLSGSSATAKWVRTPSRRSSSRVAIDSASAHASAGAQPTRCIPVSTFRCTGSGSAPVSATALARASMPAPRVDDGREAEGDDRGGGGGRRLGQDEDGRVDAGGAQLGALFDERDPEPLRAGVERGARHRHGPVPVAVGLHDRHERRRRRDAGERADVRADRVEVDLRPDGAVAVVAAISSCVAEEPDEVAAGDDADELARRRPPGRG